MSLALDNSQVRDRGRRRTRARAKIANDAGTNGCRNENRGDGWIISGVGEDRVVAQDDLVQGTEEEEPEPDVSPTLADAILKRPDSVKLRKPLTTKGQHQPSTVFKSASLINNENAGQSRVLTSKAWTSGERVVPHVTAMSSLIISRKMEDLTMHLLCRGWSYQRRYHFTEYTLFRHVA
jgi:hypothetical protein